MYLLRKLPERIYAFLMKQKNCLSANLGMEASEVSCRVRDTGLMYKNLLYFYGPDVFEY